jgi:hypothetical protein
VLDLPADLVVDGFRPVWPGKACGFDGISGGAQCVRSHMAHGDGLTGGPSSGRCGRSLYLTRTDATDEPTADLLSSVQLCVGECAGPSDQSPRAVIIGSFNLEQRQNPLCTVGGPRSHQTSIGLAERLRRSHHPPLLPTKPTERQPGADHHQGGGLRTGSGARTRIHHGAQRTLSATKPVGPLRGKRGLESTAQRGHGAATAACQLRQTMICGDTTWPRTGV